jgi:S1-C subfamily serine protease
MSVAAGARVTLTASPSADSYFAGWGGACTDHDLTCILRVRSPTAVVAPFRPLADLETSVVQLEGIACAGPASPPTMSYGTGIILGDRFIATVDHVVANLQGIDVLEHGTVVAHATIIGGDPYRDLALLRTDRPLPGASKEAVTLANRPAQINEPVAAIGYTPDAPPNVTLTAITRTNVPVSVANVPGLKRLGLLELNSPLNPGNSGGLLVSSETGEVLGLVDMRSTTGTGTGYAVSATVAKPLFAAWSRAPQPPPVTKCR